MPRKRFGRVMRRYVKGVAFEKLIMDKLIRKGYYCMRSAGSHGMADLIAIPKLRISKYIYLIQCKVDNKGFFTLEGKDILALEKFALDSPLRNVVKCVVVIKRSRSIKQYIFHQGRWRRITIFK